ncbi:nucleotidyltransferase, partial [Candidatus Woesearchaeota archaeon]|nr:nucleotidyltransferase [Candidatus Woesearchaeota archaeon]
GNAHAVYGAHEVVDGEVLILFGDTHFVGDLKGLKKIAGDGVIWVKPVEDPSPFGVVFKDGDFASKLIEKPDSPVSDLAMIGLYYFKDAKKLFSKIHHLLKHKVMTKGQFQLTDAMQLLINDGAKLVTREVKSWIDCGHDQGLFQFQAHALGKKQVVEGETHDVILIPPVFIGKGAVVKRSIIGPNVSIAGKAHVVDCVLKNSIIGSRSSVKRVGLSNSLVSEDAVVKAALKSVRLDKGGFKAL